nr:hypothetical protein Iba_scaffold14370CG0350 [Ipomoea batatas]
MNLNGTPRLLPRHGQEGSTNTMDMRNSKMDKLMGQRLCFNCKERWQHGHRSSTVASIAEGIPLSRLQRHRRNRLYVTLSLPQPPPPLLPPSEKISTMLPLRQLQLPLRAVPRPHQPPLSSFVGEGIIPAAATMATNRSSVAVDESEKIQGGKSF